MKIRNQYKLSLVATSILACASANADQVTVDDIIIQGSACIGLDCNNGESFGFDTIRMKENNVRIKAVDTSSSSSFPSTDWQLTFNESNNGGLNKFSIEDVDSNKVPFTIIGGAPSNSIYVKSNGFVGFNTSAPAVNLHVKYGNSPSLRLEQDGTSGFSSQVWDVAGNETNFFIRDATNSSKIPFKIVPNAPNNSLYIAADGDIGFETSSPDGQFDVAHSSNANNHAFLIDPSSNVGVNIDNGYMPQGLFDVQTTGGQSRLTVASDGKVGLGTYTPSASLDIYDVNGGGASIELDAGGSNVSSLTTSNTGHVTFSRNASSTANNKTIPAFNLVDEVNDNTALLMLNIKNDAPAYLGFEDSARGDRWITHNASDSSFRISYQEDSTVNSFILPFRLDKDGNLTITGDLIANGTTYTSTKKLKENFTNIKYDELLNNIRALDIKYWNYKKDKDSVVHIGPTAEQFHDLFSLNGSNKEAISISDVSGVSLAGIQALYELILKQQAEINKLKQN